MGIDEDVEFDIDDILTVRDGHLPDHDTLNDPKFWMSAVRAAYGRGYLAGLREDSLPLEEVRDFERQHWARLPVP